MGFSLGKIGAVINPVAMAATALQGGADLWATHEQSRAAKRANRTQIDIAREQAELQRVFAQHGIRWRVEDALAAGLHPLAALSASGAGYSPVFPQLMADTGKADMIRSMGQSLSRSMEATSTPEERLVKRVNQKRLQLEERELDRRLNSQVGPGFPADGNSGIGGIPGQGDSTTAAIANQLPVQIMPLGRTASPRGRPDQAYGNVTSNAFARHADGSLGIIPSPDIQGALANNAAEMLLWEIGTRVNQQVAPWQYRPSYQDHPLPDGYYWKFRRIPGRWYPAKIPAGVDQNTARSKYWKD